MKNDQLHDRDFYAWTNEQAGLLRAGRASEADIELIAEAIESMGKSEKRELVNRLRVLLLHLLKWEFQPDRRGASWEGSIVNTRDELMDLLDDNPSLRPLVPVALETAYRRAAIDVASETGLNKDSFPKACPWTHEQVMHPDFWPAASDS